MRSFFFFNWRQKATCFLLAIAIWVILKEQIEPGSIYRTWVELTGTPINGSFPLR